MVVERTSRKQELSSPNVLIGDPLSEQPSRSMSFLGHSLDFLWVNNQPANREGFSINKTERAVIMHTILKSIMVVSIVFTFGASNAQAQVASAVIPISSCEELQKIGSNALASNGQAMSLSANYVLTRDIDCSDTKNWNIDNGKALGFVPIGMTLSSTSMGFFTGRFDGQGHKITNLYFNALGEKWPLYSPESSAGLFLLVGNPSKVFADDQMGIIKNLILENVNFTNLLPGNQYVGALAGFLNEGAVVDNVHVSGFITTGSIPGSSVAGGVIGRNYGGIVRKSSSSAKVYGSQSAGGLVGVNFVGGQILESFSNGEVYGCRLAGGLVGENFHDKMPGVINSYSTAKVTGGCAGTNLKNGPFAGGLIGQNELALIETSFATGNVSLGSYAVTSTSFVGGVIGNIKTPVFAINKPWVSAKNVLWDSDTTGTAISAGSPNTSNKTDLMKQQSTYAGFDFDKVWTIKEGQDYPHLKWETPATIQITNCQQLQDMKNNLSGNYVLANDIDCSGIAFTPIGSVVVGNSFSSNLNFYGSLDGQGFTIKGLNIRSKDTVGTGLFGAIKEPAVIKNLKITGALIEEVDPIFRYGTGILVGQAVGGEISNVSVQGQIKAVIDPPLSASYVGGVVGGTGLYNLNIYHVSSDVNITGGYAVGGLIGSANGVTISDSYAKGTIKDAISASGFASFLRGSVSNSYTSVDVSTCNLCPSWRSEIKAAGFVSAVAGDSSLISNSFAVGKVFSSTGGRTKGLLIDDISSSHVVDSFSSLYWDINATGVASSGSNALDRNGKTTAQMKQQITFVGFDFTGAPLATPPVPPKWKILEGLTYPQLQWEPPTVAITNCQQLQDMKNNLSGNYVLANDIDCSVTNPSSPQNAASIWNNGKGFVPIGDANPNFTGILDGNNKIIKGLFINTLGSSPAGNPTTTGLFGRVATGGVVKNLILEGVDVKGEQGWYTGALVGQLKGGEINNVQVSGKVDGSTVGGLVGNVSTGSVIQSSANVTVRYGQGFAGGLVGSNYKGSITKSFSRGSVQGCRNIGGLAGGLFGGTVLDSYSTAKVVAECPGASMEAGIAGLIAYVGTTEGVGSRIESSFAAGNVSVGTFNVGATQKGGLFAKVDGATIGQNLFWDATLSGLSSSAGVNAANGKTTAQMKQQVTYPTGINGFDFAPTTGKWKVLEGLDYPHLAWEEYPIKKKLESATSLSNVIIKDNLVAYLKASPDASVRGVYVYNLFTSKAKKVMPLEGIQKLLGIDGTKILYSHTSGQYHVIDWFSGENVPLPSGTAALAPQGGMLSGDKVVYVKPETTATNSDVYIYSLNSRTDLRLTNKLGQKSYPVIAGENVIWFDSGENAGIYAKTAGGELRRIVAQTTTQPLQYQYIQGDKVVYTKLDQGYTRQDIYLYDLVSNQETRITDINSYKFNVKIDGDWIYWVNQIGRSGQGGERSIYVHSLINKQAYKLAVPNPLLAGNADDSGFSKDRLVYTDLISTDPSVIAVNMIDLNFNRQIVKFKMNVTGSGGGAVTSNPLGLNCFATGGVEADKACEMTLDKGSPLTLYVKPAGDAEAGDVDSSGFGNPVSITSPTLLSKTITTTLNNEGVLGVNLVRLTEAKVKMDLVSIAPKPVIAGSTLQLSIRLENITSIEALTKSIPVGLTPIAGGNPIVMGNVTLPKVLANSVVENAALSFVVGANTSPGMYKIYLPGMSANSMTVEVKRNLPDLLVQDISLVGSKKAGQNSTLRLIIKNQGQGPSNIGKAVNITLGPLAPSTPRVTRIIPVSIASDATYTIDLPVQLNGLQNMYTVAASIDTVAIESDFRNNYRTARIEVVPPGASICGTITGAGRSYLFLSRYNRFQEAQGSYCFYGLSPGIYSVSAWSGWNFRSIRVRVNTMDQDVLNQNISF